MELGGGLIVSGMLFTELCALLWAKRQAERGHPART